MTSAVFPGSFDPMTLGHLEIAKTAAGLFSELTLLIADNPRKKYFFSKDCRLKAVQAALDEAGLNVNLVSRIGLTADYCREFGVDTIIKGVRNSADFESEQSQAHYSRQIAGVPTLLILPEVSNQFISSSAVRELLGFGGDVSDLVPPAVLEVINAQTH